MDVQLVEVLALTVYKVASLATGVILSYLGYKLFMAGVWGDAGDAEGVFGDNKIIIKKAAPGTFFVIMGALVIGLTIIKGLDLGSTKTIHGASNEQPHSEKKPVLIENPEIIN
jgi:hypothetical protein